MNELVPASPPEDDGASQAVPPNPGPENHQHTQAHRRNAGQILSREQCLAGISQLPGLLVIGMLKPQTSNSMLGAFNSLLHQHERSDQPTNRPQISNEDILRTWRENPAMVRMLEPFLTDDQLQMIAQEEAKNGQA